MITEKRCSKCKEIKRLIDFSPDNTKDGRSSQCKQCRAATIRVRRAARRKPKPEIPSGMGRCSKCKEIKPASAFGKSERLRSGLFSWCRSCLSEAARIRYRNGAEERSKIVPASEGEKKCHRCGLAKPMDSFSRRSQSSDGRNVICRKCDSVRATLWGMRNPEKEKARRARRDPEKVKERNRKWIQSHWEEYRKKRQEWERQYSASHPGAASVKMAKRKARKLENGIGDPQAILAFTVCIYSAKRIRCYWCRRFVPKGQRRIDHIIPLAGKDRRGPHAEWNLCCACASCNSKKWAKDPADFGGQGELLLLPEGRA